MKKIEELFAICKDRAYYLELGYHQNCNISIEIGTKYFVGGNPSGDSKVLYENDGFQSPNKAIKKALSWLKNEDTFRND